MTTSDRSGWWKLWLGCALAMGGAIAASGDDARAQITPDATLGTESSVVTPNVMIRDVTSDRIDGGAKSGANLFHSFQEFNIGAGRGAYFTNPIGIENILSRVTGGNVSNIFGKLGVLGNANLFLINPNGIIFGPNASLDIRGAFVGSTASSLNFADGTHFSATAPSATPLLTVSVPLGLQYGGNAGSVQVQQSILQVDTGQTLALVGGNVSVDGGRLQAPGGRVELGGLAQGGTVGLNVDANPLNLSFADGATAPRADVLLTNAASVNVAASGGGSIAVNARNLELLGESSLIAGIGSGLGFPGSEAGDVSLSATEAIAIGQSSSVQNRVNQNAIGNSGDIDIQARSLSITDGAFVSASTYSQGNAGNVNVAVSDTVTLAGMQNDRSRIASIVESAALGNGGNINITAGSVSLSDRALLNAITSGQGNAGSIFVQARDSVSLSDGARVNATTSGQGDAGNIFVQARDSVSLANSFIVSNVSSTGVGNVGNIWLEAGSVSLTNGAQLQAGIFSGGQGNNAGIISVRGRDSVSFAGTGSSIYGDVEPGAVGNSSDIQISAGSVSLTDGALLNTSNAGQGNAGSVTVQATDSVLLEDSNIGSNVTSTGEGNVGNIWLEAGSVTLTDGAQLQASILSGGHGTNAGIVSVRARDSVSFAGSAAEGKTSGIFSNVESEAVGNVGSILLEAGSVTLTDGAQLQASILSRGHGTNAGIVSVRARDSVSFAGSGIFSNVQSGAEGNGSDIQISAGSVSLTDGALLNANNAGQGNAGSVSVQATDSVLLEDSNTILR